MDRISDGAEHLMVPALTHRSATAAVNTNTPGWVGIFTDISCVCCFLCHWFDQSGGKYEQQLHGFSVDVPEGARQQEQQCSHPKVLVDRGERLCTNGAASRHGSEKIDLFTPSSNTTPFPCLPMFRIIRVRLPNFRLLTSGPRRRPVCSMVIRLAPTGPTTVITESGTKTPVGRVKWAMKNVAAKSHPMVATSHLIM